MFVLAVIVVVAVKIFATHNATPIKIDYCKDLRERYKNVPRLET